MLAKDKKPKKQKKSKPQASAPALAAGPAATPALTVRHYCQGIGDCHLLSFPKPDGSLFRMLIDCGVHSSVAGGNELVDDIVADLKAETGGRIDVLVVSHEHWDHVSGFVTAHDIFKDFSVGEVWMPWTENPADPDAVALDKFRTQALSALQAAGRRLEAEQGLSGHMAGIRDGLQGVLSFQFGAKGEKVRAARDAATKLSAQQPPAYLGPDTAPFSIAGLPNLRIYVLGPPRDKTALRLEEKASEMYELSGQRGRSLARTLKAGLAAGEGGMGGYVDDASPFDRNVGTELSALLAGTAEGDIAAFFDAHYSGDVAPAQPGPAPTSGRSRKLPDKNLADQSWRRIDTDWIAIAADLAMQLDRGVNNTSLVLAFEFLDTGRVFLFPGDAQVGNWLSWQAVKWPVGSATVEASDLMARTVYLKVAHHGSQNATLEKRGLDLMASSDLSAFVPTSQKDAQKVGWGRMPYQAILTALADKTNGRVIRADDDWVGKKDGRAGFACPSGSIRAVRNAARDTARGKGGLWVEVDLA